VGVAGNISRIAIGCRILTRHLLRVRPTSFQYVNGRIEEIDLTDVE
jgi:hypothetical protein